MPNDDDHPIFDHHIHSGHDHPTTHDHDHHPRHHHDHNGSVQYFDQRTGDPPALIFDYYIIDARSAAPDDIIGSGGYDITLRTPRGA